MAARRRNPLMGGIFAMIMIGFGSYRLFVHFSGRATLETWQLVITGAVILYGLFVAYSVLTQKPENPSE
ncbi:hypothetical protein SAMN05192588_1274 [Nonlabens sp. Hel1_33_55]|uniref:hypothetical protein n=1 Tax=Nonlabens sp. Hel1_33_55 TaxID=1336802 RepID=UPI000875B81D|nr:hypothetical protein [Nonlabens sp. Hel1_33_55]SCY12611.1 hypothetical protein SAMN05192588_1274 [Nonlabens sp. Hel1_33_55]